MAASDSSFQRYIGVGTVVVAAAAGVVAWHLWAQSLGDEAQRRRSRTRDRQLAHQLSLSARSNNLELARRTLVSASEAARVINGNFQPSSRSVDGSGTPLMYAAERGHAEMVKLLLRFGPNVSARQAPEGLTALHYAASHGHGAVVRMLLQAGADKAARSHDGSTPLLMAADRGHEAACVALLEAGADPSAGRCPATTRLAVARRAGSAASDAPSTRDEDGYEAIDATPLLLAAVGGHLEVGMVLMAAGAHLLEVSATRPEPRAITTPLHAAARFGHDEFLKSAIGLAIGTASGMRVDWRSQDCDSAISGEPGEEADRPIQVDPDARRRTAEELSQARDGEGRTALMLACQGGHARLARLLLGLPGAEPDALAADGSRSPLVLAARGRHIGVLRLLLTGASAGAAAADGEGDEDEVAAPHLRGPLATVDRLDEHGMTPLHTVVLSKDRLLVRELCSLGAGLECRVGSAAGPSTAGATALHLAAMRGLTGVVEDLVALGADHQAAWGPEGLTALQLAQRAGHTEVVEALRARSVALDGPPAGAGATVVVDTAADDAWEDEEDEFAVDE